MINNTEIPIIYEENKVKVLNDLREGKVDYLDLSSWTFQDNFFGFLLSIRFFEICGSSYPSPRKKEEVPVWFLLTCSVSMKIHTSSVYSRLPGLLRSGAILSRVKFNVGGVEGGFNNKNKKKRENPVHHDCVRKFFKDSNPDEMRHWYNYDILRFLRRNRAFDKHGIFILDQSHIVVPDNENYEEATWMAVDEHGQRIETTCMSEEKKKGIKYRKAYSFSELLHVSKDENCYSVAGYQFGSGTTDELVQGRRLVQDFVHAVGKGVMKLLIVDRGYIDGEFIDLVKNEIGSDVLIPIRSNMDILNHAIRVAESDDYKKKWKLYKKYKKEGKQYTEEVIELNEVGLWDTCETSLYMSIMKTTCSDGSINYWGLATTFKPRTTSEAFELYDMRVQIEERHDQFKNHWFINKFSSPDSSLIEAHILFTLLTYTLIQLYLKKKHFSDIANKTINTLKDEERLGTNSVVIYSGKYFGIFDLDEYTDIIFDLVPQAKEKMRKWLKQFRKAGKMRGG